MADSFKAQQTTLKHNRQLYCTAEGFTAKSFNAQQTTSMHSKKIYYTAGSFIAQQKVLLHSKKVSPTAKTGEKFLFEVETGEKLLLWQKQRISTTFCPP